MGANPYFENYTKNRNNKVNIKSPINVNCPKNKSNNKFSFVKRKKQIIHTTQIYYYDSDDYPYMSDDSISPVKYTIRKKHSPRPVYNINMISLNFSNILKYAGCFSLLKRNRLNT